MAVVRWVGRYPGGRFAALLLPFLVLAVAIYLVPSRLIINATALGSLMLWVGNLWVYRRHISRFVFGDENASAVWWGLGVAGIASAATIGSAWSVYWRWRGHPEALINGPIVVALRYVYWLCAGCFFLAPMAKNDVVPARGWLLLALINLSAVVLAVATFRYFPP